jgi:2'-5' RNA ligase
MTLRFSQSSLPFSDIGQHQDEIRDTGRTRPRRSKLFFILRPTPSVRDEIYGMALDHGRQHTNCRPHPAELLHISLLLMGEFEKPPYLLIPRIEAAIGSVKARPIKIVLDGSGIYGNGRHLALTSSSKNREIQTFVRMLHAALTRHNLPREALKAVSPHVTIFYGYGRNELVTVGKTYSWLASEFALVFSHNGESSHEEFGRWRFDENAGPYPEPPHQLSLFTGAVAGIV